MPLGPVVEGRLVYRRCSTTRRPQAYGARRCECCWSDAFEVLPASGEATLLAGVRYHRTYDSRWPHPYAVVVARLAEGTEVFAIFIDVELSLPTRGTALRIELDASYVLRARVARSRS